MESVEAALDSARDAVSDLADGASGWWGDRVDEVRSKLEERRGGKGADSSSRGGKRRSGSSKKESSPQEGANTGEGACPWCLCCSPPRGRGRLRGARRDRASRSPTWRGSRTWADTWPRGCAPSGPS